MSRERNSAETARIAEAYILNLIMAKKTTATRPKLKVPSHSLVAAAKTSAKKAIKNTPAGKSKQRNGKQRDRDAIAMLDAQMVDLHPRPVCNNLFQF